MKINGSSWKFALLFFTGILIVRQQLFPLPQHALSCLGGPAPLHHSLALVLAKSSEPPPHTFTPVPRSFHSALLERAAALQLGGHRQPPCREV
jgi:hypothetical protein